MRRSDGIQLVINEFENCVDQELYLNALIVSKEWGDLGKVLIE